MMRRLILILLCWTVSAQPLSTIDGDTFRARLSVFLNIESVEHVRVLGVDTPELHGPDHARAVEARVFTVRWLGASPVTLTTCGRDSFGRVLATVKRGKDDLGEALVKSGLAVKRGPSTW